MVELIERITVYQDRRLEIKLRYQSDMENAIVKRKYLTEAALHEAVYTAIMTQIKACADTRRGAERLFSAGPAAAERMRVEA